MYIGRDQEPLFLSSRSFWSDISNPALSISLHFHSIVRTTCFSLGVTLIYLFIPLMNISQALSMGQEY